MPNPKPTQEQIDAARAYLQNRIDAMLKEPPTVGAVHDAVAFRTLLAATAPAASPPATGDVIERLARIRNDAFHAATIAAGLPPTTALWDACAEGYRERSRAGIRAVVRELGSMGAEVMPSVDDIVDAWDEAAQTRYDAGEEHAREQDPGDDARTVIELLYSRLAPILGARLALTPPAPTDEQLAEEAARSANASEGTGGDPGTAEDATLALGAVEPYVEPYGQWGAHVRGFFAGARREGLR